MDDFERLPRLVWDWKKEKITRAPADGEVISKRIQLTDDIQRHFIRDRKANRRINRKHD